jgi:AcrR family transcriptional regulator
MLDNQRANRAATILSATQRLISETGIDSATMPEIAKATGLSRPAIYQYFQSREHILAELVINDLADLSNDLDEHLKGIEEPSEQVRFWLHYSLAYMSSEQHRVISQISLNSLPTESLGMIRAMHGHFMTSLQNPLTELGIEDAMRTGQLIFASVAEAAKRIDGGSAYEFEAASLERFVISGIGVAEN